MMCAGLGELGSLEELSAYDSNFKGHFPTSLGGVRLLLLLLLAHKQSSAQLPGSQGTSLTYCLWLQPAQPNLKRLFLRDNAISGTLHAPM